MKEKNTGKPASHFRTLGTIESNRANQTLDKWLATLIRNQDSALPTVPDTDKEADHMETEQSRTGEGTDTEDNGGGGSIGLVRGLYNNKTPLDRINFNIDSYDNEFYMTKERSNSRGSHGDIDRSGTKRRQGVG